VNCGVSSGGGRDIGATSLHDPKVQVESHLATMAGLPARHETAPEVVARDVRPVLEELGALGLIEPVL
jgi:hypothetical protein